MNKVEMIPNATEVYVRIRPYNPKKGIFKQRFHTFFGFRFSEKSGWMKVPTVIKIDGRDFDVASYLKSVRQHDDEDSERVFDVCTKAEAQAIAKREKKEAELKNTPDEADLIANAKSMAAPRHSDDDEEVTARTRERRR